MVKDLLKQYIEKEKERLRLFSIKITGYQGNAQSDLLNLSGLIIHRRRQTADYSLKIAATSRFEEVFK